MSKLKLLWTDMGGVQFKGNRGIIKAWADEMIECGWEIETDPEKWEEVDLVFFCSDSQLFPEPLTKKPTILYFWGWEHGRLLDDNFKKIAASQLQMMAKCNRILVPGPITMYQTVDFGLPCHLEFSGVDGRLLDKGKDLGKENQILFLSRLVKHKHLDSLIFAMSIVKKDPEFAHLHLKAVGPGNNSYYKEVAKQCGIEVEFAELTDDEKADELVSSGLLVHPSEYEGFGLPPLEALYCGTPTVVFDIPQMRWMLQEDAHYFSSVEGLVEVIKDRYRKPQDYMERMERGQKRVKNMFTLNQACFRLWPHIHQVIKEQLAYDLRTNPEKWGEIYDQEHKRNWAYGNEYGPDWAAGPARFDPTWARHWRAEFFIDALKKCNAQKILDVGCGAVYPTIFAREGLDVTAMDISPNAIEQVIEIAKKWGVDSKITPVVGQAEDIPYIENTFDAVIQAEIWEHVPDVDKIIKEGLRVLKPGGYLIASTPCGTAHYDPMHMRVFNDGEMKALTDDFVSWGMVNLIECGKIAELEGDEPSCYIVIFEKK